MNKLYFELKNIIIMSTQLQSYNINEVNESINKIKTQISENLIVLRNNKINKLIELTSNYITDKEAYAILIYFDNLLEYNIEKMAEFKKLCELSYNIFEKYVVMDNLDDNKFIIESNKKYVNSNIKQEYNYLINETDKKTFKNTLLALKVFNRFANNENIRVEDAITIFKEYVFEI